MLTKLCLFLNLVVCTSCSVLPELFQSVEEMATDEAVEAVVYKNAMQKDTDITIDIKVINKDPK